nr:MAG: helix-turn-helix domain protein [Bacteriophage sp.]
MPEEYRNIYKICRKSAGFTQEAAAERLGISVESLRAYETGQRVPPDEVVETMSDLYNALHLIVRHVRERNAMYSRVVPEVPQCSVLEASAKLTNRIYAFADSHADRRLMQMAEDNVIDSAERPEFDAIMEDLQCIVEAAMAVRYAKQGHLEEGVK